MRAEVAVVVVLALALGASACERCGGAAKSESDASTSASSSPAVTSGDASRAGPAPFGVVGAEPQDASTRADTAVGPWNVLLFTVDSLRADMPWAGYSRPIAPRLSALHARSVAYTNAYATSSFTSKSIPGLLTGRYPSELTRTGSFFTKYINADQFVCKHLGAEGIPCVGAHAHMYFGPGQSGFETGFQTWKIVPGITFDYQTDPYVTSDKLAPMAIEVLQDVGKAPADKPWLAWFHFMDPHDEYKSHEESPHFGKRPRDLYDEEVFFTDLWIGKVLDFVEAQPWAKRTAIVVTADHGEAFGEHGITRHAHEVWEELVHVPLFVVLPLALGIAPRTIETTRGHADLAPTFVELLGAKSVPALPGKSLLGEIVDAKAPPEERDVIVDLPEDDYNERRRALIHGRKKIIAFGEDARFALYDLESDPKEATDLILKDPELATDMRRRYKEASKRIVSLPPRGGIPRRDK